MIFLSATYSDTSTIGSPYSMIWVLQAMQAGSLLSITLSLNRSFPFPQCRIANRTRHLVDLSDFPSFRLPSFFYMYVQNELVYCSTFQFLSKWRIIQVFLSNRHTDSICKFHKQSFISHPQYSIDMASHCRARDVTPGQQHFDWGGKNKTSLHMYTQAPANQFRGVRIECTTRAYFLIRSWFNAQNLRIWFNWGSGTLTFRLTVTSRSSNAI